MNILHSCQLGEEFGKKIEHSTICGLFGRVDRVRRSFEGAATALGLEARSANIMRFNYLQLVYK